MMISFPKDNCFEITTNWISTFSKVLDGYRLENFDTEWDGEERKQIIQQKLNIKR